MKEKSGVCYLPVKLLLVNILFVIFILYFSLLFYSYIPSVPSETAFPSPESIKQSHSSSSMGIWDFNPYAALTHLKSLTDLGDRVSGSYENEIVCQHYLSSFIIILILR